jgi:hypothetical protein
MEWSQMALCLKEKNERGGMIDGCFQEPHRLRRVNLRDIVSG